MKEIVKIIFPFTVLILSLHFFVENVAQGRTSEIISSLLSDIQIFKEPRQSGIFQCKHLKDKSLEFLKLHYSVKTWNQELSHNTLNKFFSTLDPGKNFFLQSDIDEFQKKESSLQSKIMDKDCSDIIEIHTRFITRAEETFQEIRSILKNKPNFDLDESIETDRKKINWSQTKEDRKERWRKMIKLSSLSLDSIDKNWDKTSHRLKKRYDNLIKSMKERTTDDINGIFINSLFLCADPHSQYLMPEDQNEFKEAFSLQLVGIGATLTQSDGYTIVDSLVPGGAAFRDGHLQKGDKIIGVDNHDNQGPVDVVDLDLTKVVKMIRGKKDTKVTLKISRQFQTFDIQLVRDIVNIEQGKVRSDVMILNQKRIGVILMPSFYIDYQGSRTKKDFRSSYLDMLTEIESLKKRNVDGIILNLTSNGGGDLGECLKITSLFMNVPSIVQVEDQNRKIENLYNPVGKAIYDGPLVVLISKMSASASEIFSGAVQDYGRALIVGNEKTYGKGTVQNVVENSPSFWKPNESTGALKVTVSKFFLPSGRTNQAIGVPSDIVIPDWVNELDISESENEYVLPSTSIDPFKGFKKIRDFKPFLETLKQKSQERIHNSKEFKELETKLVKFREEKTKSLVPLKRVQKKETEEQEKIEKRSSLSKVIDKKDIQLYEAAHILVDSIEMNAWK